ncbi:hypothetical protein HDK90DRAFT_472609 [Phyllosticta capitalensis]|uniref:F-box domain-containing protein n=1 Tax=Phyllosticta capitalensis TaxID=121624 RepID=A0ABR1Z3W8_9PEZI
MSQHDIATLAQVVTLKSLGLLSDSEITYRTGVSSDAIQVIYEKATQRGFDPRTTRTITKRHLAPSMSAQALPVRVQLQILSHLPLTSLIKMHCVSRHWRDLIDSQMESRKSPISSSRRALLQIYLEAVHQPFFLPSRRHILPHVRPFDREAYVAALVQSFNSNMNDCPTARLPDDFLTWILEWPSSAVIGMLWPGIDNDFGSVPPSPKTSLSRLSKHIDRQRRTAAVVRWYRAGYRNKLPDPSRLLSSPRPLISTGIHSQDLDPWPTPPPTPPMASPNTSCPSTPTTTTAPPLFYQLPTTAGAPLELELERFIQTTESSPQMRSILVLSPASTKTPPRSRSHSAPLSPPETPSPASPVSPPAHMISGSSYFPAPGCYQSPSTTSSSNSSSTVDFGAPVDMPRPKPGRVYAQVCGASRTVVFASWAKYLEAKLHTVEAFWDEWGRREEAATLYPSPSGILGRERPTDEPSIDEEDGVGEDDTGATDVWIEGQPDSAPLRERSTSAPSTLAATSSMQSPVSPQKGNWIGREVSGMQAFGVVGAAEPLVPGGKRVTWGADTRVEFEGEGKEVRRRWSKSWRWRLGWEVGKWRAKRLMCVPQG